jgi:hypothetical protein
MTRHAADGEEGDTTMPCPYCRRAIYDDAVRCPYCENYLSEEDSAGSPKSGWLIAGVVVCVGVVVWWVLRGQ